jgi:hypothetical protein
MSDVIYKEVDGFPGYKVGTDGSVWSCRMKDGSFKNSWHRLRTSKRRKQRYLTVCFRTGPKNHGRYVHRLVLAAFVGPCPEGMESCHKNGNPEDNRVENLRWDTHQSNIDDKLKHGTQLQGSQIYCAKLEERDIVFIRRLYEHGIPQDVIGDVYGVDQSHVSEIVLRKIWKHVP